MAVGKKSQPLTAATRCDEEPKWLQVGYLGHWYRNYGAGAATKATKWPKPATNLIALTDDVHERTYIVNGDSNLVSMLKAE